MAKKRYQVFLSSTYEDLKDERFAVMESLQTIKCFVAGMEYFSAVDINQFEYIKKVIDDCDYYLLVLGGRYGTVPNDEEKSYTEKEYNYAVSKNKPIIALLHQDISSLPSGRCEQSEIQKKRYTAFRNKLSQGRLVNYWRDISELQAKALSGVVAAIENFPDVPGWVRGDSIASEDILRDVEELRKENKRLKNETKNEKYLCLERLKNKYKIKYKHKNDNKIYLFSTTFEKIFCYSMDLFIKGEEIRSSQKVVNSILKDIIIEDKNISRAQIQVQIDESLEIISLFILLNLIYSTTIEDEQSTLRKQSLGYKLTEFGKSVASELIFG